MHSPEYVFLSDGKYKLFKKRDSGIDTYIKVDDNDNPILEKQGWSYHPQEKLKIIKNERC